MKGMTGQDIILLLKKILIGVVITLVPAVILLLSIALFQLFFQ